ncbi:iron-sulfur cluster biosynthesis family protein [Marinicrinis lubricantis]|uniref:Iron-sulfur cluster biosynthesis family protein n=1 Tax=Marinicrinis lubricantis TaxID=2086470 RepID=A0ABW1ITX9_9BACL
MINVTITEEASKEIERRLGSGQAVIKLVYDTEGCGCAVDGVPQLWVLDRPSEEDIPLPTNVMQFVFEPRQEVFFEEQLKLGYREQNKSFVLSSSQQTYGSHLTLIDRREH